MQKKSGERYCASAMYLRGDAIYTQHIATMQFLVWIHISRRMGSRALHVPYECLDAEGTGDTKQSVIAVITDIIIHKRVHGCSGGSVGQQLYHVHLQFSVVLNTPTCFYF